MRKLNMIILLIIFPILLVGQNKEWHAPVDIIQKSEDGIEKILFYESDSENGYDLDSLAITNDQKFDNVILTTYDTELAMDKQVDYYVVGMDISLLNLIIVEEKENQLKLTFSRYCDHTSTDETQVLELNFSSENDKEKILGAFKQILEIRNTYHERMHELNQCSLEIR